MMRTWTSKRIAASVVIFLLSVLPASAQVGTITQYQQLLKLETGRIAVRQWLNGFGTGVGMYEVTQRMEKKPGRFCIPRGVSLSAELLAGIIDTELERTHWTNADEIAVSAVLWIGLARNFPCL